MSYAPEETDVFQGELQEEQNADSVVLKQRELYRKIQSLGFSELELFAMVRFFYRYGFPIIPNAKYDVMALDMKAKYPDDELCKQPYDDDPIPFDLLKRLNLDKKFLARLIYGTKRVSSEENREIFDRYLAVEKSKSINAFFEWTDAMPWLYSMRGRVLNLSLKVDGNNTQSVYLPSEESPDVLEYKVTFSRGRETQPFDLTSGCSRVLPQRLRIPGLKHLILRAEIYCDPDAMDALNLKYGTELVTPRGVGLSMARTNGYEDEDYSSLMYNVFYASCGSRVSETLDMLYKAGVDTVPYYTVKLPEDATESQIQELVFKYMANLKAYADANGIPSDGVVVQVDSTETASELATDEQYDAGIIAIKTDFWKPDVLQSEVLRIEISQQHERANCVAIVRPVTTASGKTISRVNCFNPDILISAGIKPGSVIQFNYKNETTVDLIY